MRIPAELKKWLAFGSGIGIEIAGPHGAESLHIAAVRVRPGGARLIDRLTIPDFPNQPAGVLGTEYNAFLRKLGLQQSIAAVLLPRQDVIVRQLSMLGVSDKDLPAAVQYQIEGLHPYSEDDVVTSWARLEGTSCVLVAIARRSAIGRYADFFGEAGIRIGGFSCSAAAIHSALRLFGNTPPAEILAVNEIDGHREFYGESPARPIFSASFPASEPRAAALACSELRIDAATEPRPLDQLLAAEPALPFAAALASACPLLTLPVNLLPMERRQFGPRRLWILPAALGAAVLMLAIALWVLPGFERQRYLQSLNAEIARVQPQAERAARLEREADTMRARAVLLDDFRHRAKSDMDVLAEMTKIMAPPTWLNSLEVSRTQVVAGGEADQAAPLLKLIDASPLFESSEFSMPPTRTPNGEAFRMRRMAALAGLLLAVGLIIRFWPESTPTVVAPVGDNVAFAEKKLAKLRDEAATVPSREQILKKATADLATREKSLIVADSAPLAQTQLIQIIRDLGRAETPPVEIRSTELPPVRPLGDAYGEASVSVQVECRIDQLVNILAGIAARPELVSTSDLRISSNNAKDKTLGVRLTVSGVVPRKLVPGKRT
jgi:hypothetical protein